MNAPQLWWKAIRPHAYSASVVPIAIGGLYARATGAEFSPVRLGLTLMSGMLLHTAANLWNDYHDYQTGVDHPGGGIGSGVLVRGEMTAARCFQGAALCAALGAAIGLWLAWRVGWKLLGLGGAGLFGAWAYSAGPLSPKHRALGEVWAFLFMGVGLTLGGYMAQTGTFSWGAIAAGVPAGLLMTLLLYTNNLRDLASDRAVGLRTLPMLFKPVEANIVAGLFLIFPFLFTGLMAGTRQLPQGTLWCLLALPLALHRFHHIWKGPVGHADVLGIARLHLAFGLLFIWGLWV